MVGEPVDGGGIVAAEAGAGDGGGGLPCFGSRPEGLEAMNDYVDALHALSAGEGDGSVHAAGVGEGVGFSGWGG